MTVARVIAGVAVVMVAGALFVVGVRGQSPPAAPPTPAPSSPPVLSETDRLKVINASQSIEIWTLRVQQAAGELQKARTDFDKVVAGVTPTGWMLNDKLEFVKVEK